MFPPTTGWVLIDRILGILIHFLPARALKFLRQKNLIHSNIKPQVPRDPHVRWIFLEVIRHLIRAFTDESALQLAVQSYYQVKERRCAHRSTESLSPARHGQRREKSGRDWTRQRSRSRGMRRSHRRDRWSDRKDQPQFARDDARGERRFESTRNQGRDGGKGGGPNTNVTCFACQQKGHYTSDPACPEYIKRDKPALWECV